MTERWIEYFIEHPAQEMKMYFFLTLLAGILGLALLVFLYNRIAKPTRTDDLFNTTIIVACCIFFFCSGFFLGEWIDNLVESDSSILKENPHNLKEEHVEYRNYI